MTNQIEPITRVTRSKQEARKTYNKLSHWYDALAGSSEEKYTRSAIEALDLQANEVALEIGFGTGNSILLMAQKVGRNGQVHGIDLSEGMLEVTQEKVKKAALPGRIELITGDAIELPYKSNSFDAILISFTLELFDTPEIPVVLSQCRRVMKSGAHISVVSMSKLGAGVGVKIYEWLHRKLPAWVDCRPIYLRDSLDKAGFKIVEWKHFSLYGLSGEHVLAKNVK